jgi:formamidopyrimidine-DNA glycosylase
MPELPEVETIRRGLDAKVAGRTVQAVEVRAPKIFIGDPDLLEGKTLRAFDRYGKLLVVDVEGEYLLTIHLKMTGQLIWQAGESGEGGDEVVGGHPEESYLLPLPHRHTHVIFYFEDGSTLYFNDLRKFGRMELLPANGLEAHAFVQKLGPEPLEGNFTYEYLEQRLKLRPRLAIKTFLLDQTHIAGLGNIYADESLFRAAIHPNRPAGRLSPGEVRNLFDAIQETIEIALAYGGSSSQHYVDAVGNKGTFLKIANVYRRTGQDCNRCPQGVIERLKIGGRSSHFCPVCQR